MLSKIVRIIVVGVVLALAYWAIALLFTVLAFGFAPLATVIVLVLLVLGFCFFVLKEFGVTA